MADKKTDNSDKFMWSPGDVTYTPPPAKKKAKAKPKKK
jgi:hypothetical protein